MKLIHHTLRGLLVPLLVLFALWGWAFYSMVLHEVEDETDDTLANYKEIIIRSALADSSLLCDHADIMSRYSIREVAGEEARLNHDEFFDSTQYIEIEKEHEPVRVLRTWFRTASGRYYELTISISTLEKEDMKEAMVWGMLLLYVLLIGCMLPVIHVGFRRSLRPLYRLLDWLRAFQVGKTTEPLDNPTQIDEFKTLNEAAEESFHRSNDLYNRQKQFVENAAHELQTPLAICLNRVELMSENPDCTEAQLQEMADLHRTLSDIIRLNKTLLLLTRIENNQFPDTRDIDVNRLVRRMMADFSDIYEGKALHLRVNEEGTLRCMMNESLASTLVANLLKNAFVHNHQGGAIEITLTDACLTIANTDGDRPLDTALLFGRFARQGKHPESTGLGLAIVKAIADLYAVQIAYLFEGGMHKFHLIFAK